MQSQKPPGVVQNWSTLQCSKHDIEQCGYDHAPVTRGRMRTQLPLPHGPSTNPKMVEWNNAFCRRRRFCFRHTAGGIFSL